MRKGIIGVLFILLVAACSQGTKDPIEEKIDKLLSEMTLEEKIGQLEQLNGEKATDELLTKIKEGKVGSFLNAVNPEEVNKMQRVAVEESRLGIPLIFARDVIHGFKTIFPIPLGQAASWNPEVTKNGAEVAALEATSVGVRWTFAPMIDVSRDARWGRIAESLGEDPYLTSVLGAAMVKGFQGENLSNPTSMLACAKHFAGYGAVEGGVDYNTSYISGEQMRNTYLPPFKAALDAGCATFMNSYNEVNGTPNTANQFLTKTVLREEWGFDGILVSDWASLQEFIPHGLCKDGAEAAERGINGGVDMDMMGHIYSPNLAQLVKEKKVKESEIDKAVRHILRIKFRLGLFEQPYVDVSKPSAFYSETSLQKAKEAAVQSLVLLKNDNNILPLSEKMKSIAVIGPLADAPHEQLGTWIFDGEDDKTITPAAALNAAYGDRVKINFAKGLEYSRDMNTAGFAQAVAAARASDVILYFAGEESLFSGEACCRADISLPGAQKELLAELAKTGKPIVLIMMAGRQIEIYKELPSVDAFLYAWHPGTMGGPAIADLLFGKAVPSGKLPVSYPKMSGQMPLYYNHKNTGRPMDKEVVLSEIPIGVRQHSTGNRSYYLDAGSKPLFPFGYGLSYTTFEYTDLKLSKSELTQNDSLTISCSIKNTGNVEAVEIVQLYIRDMVGSITRPVKELKDFQRIALKPGEAKEVVFTLKSNQLSFWKNEKEQVLEPGDFKVWIAKNSAEGLEGDFVLK